MDKLAQQLITLELAIPGIYATAVKLTAGADATVTVDTGVIGAFLCWFAALLLALVSLIPAPLGGGSHRAAPRPRRQKRAPGARRFLSPKRHV